MKNHIFSFFTTYTRIIHAENVFLHLTEKKNQVEEN